MFRHNEEPLQQFETLPAECQQYISFTLSAISVAPPVSPFNASLTSVTVTLHSECHVHQSIICSQYPDGSLHSGVRRQLAETFLNLLEKAVGKRVTNIPSLGDVASQRLLDIDRKDRRVLTTNHLGHSTQIMGNAKVGVLFSGGVDSIVLAAIADRLLYNQLCSGKI